VTKKDQGLILTEILEQSATLIPVYDLVKSGTCRNCFPFFILIFQPEADHPLGDIFDFNCNCILRKSGFVHRQDFGKALWDYFMITF
jgi:hypothetical protein